MDFLLKEGTKNRNIKTLSQLRTSIVKTLTKGDVFRWHDEPNENEMIAASKRRAEEIADRLISEHSAIIPKRIKRDA